MKNRQGDVNGSLENENGGFEERLKMMERLPPPHADLIRGHITHATQNYKNATMGLKCWPIDFVDVEMTWKWCGNDVESFFN